MQLFQVFAIFYGLSLFDYHCLLSIKPHELYDTVLLSAK